jgi:hypothetical protein
MDEQQLQMMKMALNQMQQDIEELKARLEKADADAKETRRDLNDLTMRMDNSR